MNEIKRLFSEVRNYRWMIVLALVLTFVAEILGLIFPWVYREVINIVTNSLATGLNPEVWRSFWIAVAFFAGLIISEKIVDTVKWTITNLLRVKIFVYLNNKAMRHLMKLPTHYFADNSVGFIGERVSHGVRRIAGLVPILFFDLLPALITLIGVLVIMVVFDYRMGLIFLIGTPLFIWITFIRAKILKRTQDKIRDQHEKLGRSIYQMISNIRLVKLFTSEKAENNKFLGLGKKIYKLFFQQELFLRLYEIPRELITTISFISVVGLGGYLVLTGQYKVGDLVLFIVYIQMVFSPLYRLTRIYDNYTRSMISVRRLFKIFDMETESGFAETKNLDVKKGEIKFKNVNFTYKQKRLKGQGKVLKNINLIIKPKEVVAIVGPSGVGKTTIVKLLTRFENPSSGSISIDGQRIDKVNYISLRKNISVVSQDEQTFSDTIKNNIKYGLNKVAHKDLEEAAKVANIYNFVMRLPKKFNTFIGERGVKLSGGERQRVAIARAVLKNAPILILDEATSALDSENEKQIQESIWKLIEGKTALIIAHRLSTVKKADRIIVIEDGRITEQGNHEELMDKSGYYRRLFTMQGDSLKN